MQIKCEYERTRVQLVHELAPTPEIVPGEHGLHDDAQGWSGTVSGRQSTANRPQPMMKAGRASARAAPLGSFQVIRARVHRRATMASPMTPSSSAGTPRYQITQ